MSTLLLNIPRTAVSVSAFKGFLRQEKNVFSSLIQRMIATGNSLRLTAHKLLGGRGLLSGGIFEDSNSDQNTPDEDCAVGGSSH